jgi:hypothetical protein
MADAKRFCPECGSPDLVWTPLKNARCQLCGWEGDPKETTGVVTSDIIWDSERVSTVLLRVMAHHAAGPVVQALEFTGLLPRVEPRVEERGPGRILNDADKVKARLNAKRQGIAQEMRDAVMRKVIEGALVAAITEAETQHRLHAAELGIPIPIAFKEPS